MSRSRYNPFSTSPNSDAYLYSFRRSHAPRKPTWPPSASVEDETTSLAREVRPVVELEPAADHEPPTNTRGTVDQSALLEEIDLPPPDTQERRFVLVSELGVHVDAHASTHADKHASAPAPIIDPPVYTKRTPTPYAYTPANDVLDDSDIESEEATRLRAGRKPAQYSFVKADLQRDHVRIHLGDTRPEPEPRQPDSRDDSYPQSPISSRPSSRANNIARPPTPLSIFTAARPPTIETDWQATYPPPTAAADRSRPPSRHGRHETMPVPAPRFHAQSPSPARPPPLDSSLPYPVDDRAAHAYMPFEEHYQFGHPTVASPRQMYPDSPRVSSSSIPGTPRESSAAFRPPVPKHDPAALEEVPRLRKSRSNSLSSRSSLDGRHEKSSRTPAPLNLDKPLPSCPRSTPSAKYNDWYTLKGYRNFNICPNCYEGVFADTPFALHFAQTRLHDRPTERLCDFSSPWMRLAWLLTVRQRRQSLHMLYALADIAESERPCPGDGQVGSDRVSWYGIPDQRDGIHVANFSICSCDMKMIHILFPTMRGYFTRLPITYPPSKSPCSLRITSRRFPEYLDLLVELDTEAQSLGQRPNINRFIQLARDNAFKGECGKDKHYFRKPWHFIPSLPEFTVCEECYAELIWPAMQSSKSAIPRLFTKTIQLVPQEDPDVGSSCALYSPRMRRIWETSVREDDFMYLKRKAVERKRAETRLGRERKGIMGWMAGIERGGREWERAKRELADVEREWGLWE